jgi:hypothetical protein
VARYRFKAEKNLSRQFRDFSIGMKANPNTEDFSIVKNENAIKQARVKSMLFENFDVFMIEGLTDEIRNTLKRLEPRVAVNDVRCSVDDTNELAVEIDYTIIGEQLVYTVDFLLEKA